MKSIRSSIIQVEINSDSMNEYVGVSKCAAENGKKHTRNAAHFKIGPVV